MQSRNHLYGNYHSKLASSTSFAVCQLDRTQLSVRLVTDRLIITRSQLFSSFFLFSFLFLLPFSSSPHLFEFYLLHLTTSELRSFPISLFLFTISLVLSAFFLHSSFLFSSTPIQQYNLFPTAYLFAISSASLVSCSIHMRARLSAFII